MRKDKRETAVKWLGKAVLMIALFLAVFIGVANLFSVVTNKVIDLSVKSMDELTLHDETTILKSLEYRWKTLSGIGAECRQAKCGTINELLSLLNLKGNSVDCIDLALVDEDGGLYFSGMFTTEDENISSFCQNSGERFAVRYDGEGHSVESRSEGLLLGVSIKPFTVENKNFTHIVCRYHINTLDEELKIDCYDGQGYSSVVDSEGSYIVNLNRSHSVRERDNFFTDISEYELHDGETVEKIREKIEKKEAFTISFESDKGGELMHFTPIEEVDWYFVMSVSRSVFEKQSMELIRIVLLIFIAMGSAVILVLFLFYRGRRSAAQAKIDQKHREELNEALNMAESANRAKTTFLNNMSHDIRTPMNAIIGFTNLAAKHLDNKEQLADYLGKISRSSAHLLSLINDVLDMSRIESGKVVIEEKPENLAEILQNVRSIIQTDIHSKQLELYVDAVNVTDEDIFCDKLRLNQILLNLLSNAMKFTPAGGSVSLRLTEKESDREGCGSYELRVKDTGIGMSPEFAATIFEPFTRERTATVSGIQGTGLGMSITKNIVDMMGGTIEVHSEKDKGTEFVISLSFRLQDERKEPVRIPELEGVRALVADDDMDACQSVCQMLRLYGLRAEWTMYGKEAVARVKEAVEIGDSYEFYMIDWQMPDLDGLETVRRIRKTVGSEPPILLLTAYDWSDIEAEARGAGVTDFIGKPLFPSVLNRTLERLYGKTAEQNAPEEEETVSFKDRRLLLVEDNELNREIATELLEEWGFLIETAENGQEAVDAVKASERGYFDAVLMDVQMPVMNGYEASRAIRALDDPELSKILIIAMTANAFEEDKQEALKAGMNDHLGKPIDVPTLLETLKKYLS
ncbi:MAG: response regulator [Lachnospiraceae bacterium]|nr:response regulator [Ruminococcus sp.]MCM1275292.1 response regulator [Lachnospiraceae bacterium]